MDYEKLWDERYIHAFGYRENIDPYVWIEKYLTYFEGIHPPRALDLGCGDAVASGYLMKKGFDVTATDLSAVALSIASERNPGLKTLHLNMLDGLPFADRHFGVVAAGLSTHYFSLVDTRRVFADVRRILIPGGGLPYQGQCPPRAGS